MVESQKCGTGRTARNTGNPTKSYTGNPTFHRIPNAVIRETPPNRITGTPPRGIPNPSSGKPHQIVHRKPHLGVNPSSGHADIATSPSQRPSHRPPPASRCQVSNYYMAAGFAQLDEVSHQIAYASHGVVHPPMPSCRTPPATSRLPTPFSQSSVCCSEPTKSPPLCSSFPHPLFTRRPPPRPAAWHRPA